jgi:hypothetical protein
MTHKEFKLVVEKEILEIGTGYSASAVHYKVGYILTVNQDTFDRLKLGETIEWMTQEGFVKFDKNNFNNEVEVTIVTIEYTINKLGIRKKK